VRPIHLQNWIDAHRHLLKPPVGNQHVWEDRDFMVTVVGGPNARTDFHVNEGEEFFYQLEGEMNLRQWVDGRPVDCPIRAGEIYLLPPRVPHSPQRPAGTVGLVIEHRRLSHQQDGFLWFCEQCHTQLYAEFLHVTDLVTQLPPVFDRFFSMPEHCVCKACGWKAERRRAEG
jgi:3-hydroxyanthranilate 3,4-dioxygenase